MEGKKGHEYGEKVGVKRKIERKELIKGNK